jgi:hypothetical protein
VRHDAEAAPYQLYRADNLRSKIQRAPFLGGQLVVAATPLQHLSLEHRQSPYYGDAIEQFQSEYGLRTAQARKIADGEIELLFVRDPDASGDVAGQVVRVFPNPGVGSHPARTAAQARPRPGPRPTTTCAMGSPPCPPPSTCSRYCPRPLHAAPRAPGIPALPGTIERKVRAGRIIHVILDDYGSHKHPKVLRWLARHPRWIFHSRRPQARG